MWLVTALLFFNAWLLGFFGFLLAAVGMSLTALSATDDGRTAPRVGGLIAALGVWGLLSSLALLSVVRVELILVVEFALCSVAHALVSMRDPR